MTLPWSEDQRLWTRISCLEHVFDGTEISVLSIKCKVKTLLTNLLGWVGLLGLGQLGLLVWLIDKLIDGLVQLILF